MRVRGLEFIALGFRFGVSGWRVRVNGFGIGIERLELRASRPRASTARLRASRFMFGVYGLSRQSPPRTGKRFGVSGVGIKV